jgi:hypothetical protein
MLWLATIEPKRRSPLGSFAVAAAMCGYLAYDSSHGPGRWRE